ncbi:MAG: hypothetical protein HUJ25_04560 [Crocinitomicaceae bacterium]|nr:hypothetical protein [Crocinitomicaceae bacterium]
MNFQKLELHISRVERSITISRNSFPNHPNKQKVYDNLISLFEGIKKSNYKAFNEDNLSNTKFILDLIFDGIQYLHYADESELPQRLIFCLDHVLDDWIPDGSKNYHVVISYNDSMDDFLFRYLTEEVVQKVDLWVSGMFGVSYKPSLVQISKPKILFDDFLGCTPVYHELGHFIDNNYQIIEDWAKRFGFTDKQCSYYMEHFADVFAAQYIGRSCIEPLNYNAPGTKNMGTDMHPANEKRIQVVEAFLSGTGTPEAMQIVEDLKNAVLSRGCGELKIRNIALDVDPFVTSLPIELDDPGKIHSLYSCGWQHWLDLSSDIRRRHSEYIDCCNEINQIISETINLTMNPTVNSPNQN